MSLLFAKKVSTGTKISIEDAIKERQEYTGPKGLEETFICYECNFGVIPVKLGRFEHKRFGPKCSHRYAKKQRPSLSKLETPGYVQHRIL